MDDQPFLDFKISSHEFLDTLEGRSECPKCKRSRKYYCYTCFVPVDKLQDLIPSVKLPVKIDIIKHPSEVDGKSTSAHAKVLAPDDVNIYTYPCIPDYPRDGSVVLVFPGDNSCTIQDLAKDRLHKNDMQQIHKSESQGCLGTEKNVDNAGSSKNPATEEISSELKTQSSPCGTNLSSTITHDKAEHIDSNNTLSENTDERSPKLQTLNGTSGEVTAEDQNQSNNSFGSLSESVPMQHERKRKLENDEETTVKKKYHTPVFEKAVFIDSTWNQTSRISADERLKGLPCVIVKDRESKFWRHQKEYPASFLATIEAIYYLVLDYHDLFISTNYNGEYDNLLFFFVYMYNKIHGLNSGRTLKADLQRKKLKN